MKITVISGSRADYGLLEWPMKALDEDNFFDVSLEKIWGLNVAEAFTRCTLLFQMYGPRPDIVLLLGDRFEILAAAMAAHLLRIPIAHIGGGDVTEGSYDDAMRDAISRMASIHFVTSTSAMARLSSLGLRNLHLVGNPGVDFIRHAAWRGERPYAEPYVVVNYQVETSDGAIDFAAVIRAIGDRKAIIFRPNRDLGSDHLNKIIDAFVVGRPDSVVLDFLQHGEFLNLLAHCDEFIGNSSSMLYEAPELGIKTRMIGKRQKGRAIPEGDGKASERIARILKYTAL